ncbi:chromate resistance protein ChrB domain-containing protein [Reyranella sp.]|uniref:chromate resistance protein ChrB domain-containing protein n=1 Tax=Reyranella sp. TaxID=1929291 RepID=UPI002723D46F|nr:chromate resistance protein ChrB domain-containing protein [Reyranella sp.]MDO8972418.1 chromate resistance protein [Reyranella sp.]
MSRNETPEGVRWLLLIHQLPAKPAYARVKIWRRLKGLGAVTVKNSVYVLPANAETQEDFTWLVKEIAELGGEAFVCEAHLVDGLDDGEVQALFEAARDEDYAEIAAAARELGGKHTGEAGAEVATQVARLRKQLDDIVAIDFFGADGREPAEGLVSGLEAGLHKEVDAVTTTGTGSSPSSDPLNNRVWVTRQGVQVDRIASAWLIRRFIDAAARFKFVPGTGYAAQPGELRFDMFEGEFTHRGDRCTFEVLLAEAKLDDPALIAIGEIIHDIDLKDGKYGRAETAGVRSLIAGIAAAHDDDTQRLTRGAVLLDDLYNSFASTQGGKK